MSMPIQIDDDVYQFSQLLSEKTQQPINQVISNLLRQIFNNDNKVAAEIARLNANQTLANVTGIEPFTTGKYIVTDEQVTAIRQLEGI